MQDAYDAILDGETMKEEVKPAVAGDAEPDSLDKLEGEMNETDEAAQELADLDKELELLDKDAMETHRKINDTRAQLADSHGYNIDSLAPTREEDERSIFVTGFDRAVKETDITEHFKKCGEVKRVTIKTTSTGLSKGIAFIEFEKFEAVKIAMMLNQSYFRGKEIAVMPKRTNVPGLKQAPRGRGRGSYRVRGRGRGGFRSRGRGFRGRGHGFF